MIFVQTRLRNVTLVLVSSLPFLSLTGAFLESRRCPSFSFVNSKEDTPTRHLPRRKRSFFARLALTNSTLSSSTITTKTSDITVREAQSYLEQAQALRKEAQELRRTIDAQEAARKERELARIDKWIDDLLVADRIDTKRNKEGDSSAVELLYSVEQVTQLLQDKRMSEEHVMSMFRRLSQLSPSSRSRCSPLVELLVEAAGRMDCMEREDQPNKRWSGKVERKLRRRLFANDWGINLDDLEEQERKRLE